MKNRGQGGGRFYFGLALVFLIGLGGEIYLSLSLARKGEEAGKFLEAKIRNLRAKERADPSPTVENLQAARRDLNGLEERLESIRKTLAAGFENNSPGESRPLEPKDLYFNLVAFIEAWKGRAKAAGIRLRKKERFGFGELIKSGTGPPPAQMERVYGERVAIAFLLQKLFQAEPEKLLEVRRGSIPAEGGRAIGKGGSPLSEDRFVMEKSASVAVPGVLETTAVRLGFTGQTRSLRQFLNGLSRFEMPLVVRRIEVRPWLEKAVKKDRMPLPPTPFEYFEGGEENTESLSAVPIVQDNTSEFTLIVEHLAMAGAGEWEAPAKKGEGNSPSLSSEIELENHPYLFLESAARKEPLQKTWKRPVRQSWDEKAIFEIFTPPIIYYKKTSHSFSLEPPLPSLRPNAFPEMELIGIKARPYRFRFEGFVGEKDHFAVLLGNRESGTGLRGRVGDRFPEDGISLQSFRVDRKLIHPENSALTPYWVEVVALDLFDERLQEVVSLGGDGHFPDGKEAHFRAKDDNSELFLSKLGDPTPFGGFIYTLREINLVNRSVTVEKRGVGSKETITKTFFITP